MSCWHEHPPSIAVLSLNLPKFEALFLLHFPQNLPSSTLNHNVTQAREALVTGNKTWKYEIKLILILAVDTFLNWCSIWRVIGTIRSEVCCHTPNKTAILGTWLKHGVAKAWFKRTFALVSAPGLEWSMQNVTCARYGHSEVCKVATEQSNSE